MSAALEFDRVDFSYAHSLVLSEMSFALQKGELMCLLGPSGCGKSTALRLSAGFEAPHAGTIQLNGKLVASSSQLVPPEARKLGMVFQDFALFPHLSVRANVAFGLHRLERANREQRTRESLERVGIAELAERYPHELSGGQQQRVALARALAPEPELMLLDEPFSSLDTRLRISIAREVRDLLRERGISALLVTHDQDEAFAFADRIGVMHNGRLEQIATPFALYHEPASRFIAGFVGEGALLAGTASKDGFVDTALGRFAAQIAHSGPVEVLLRPDDFELDPSNGHAMLVVDQAFRGAETLHRLRFGEQTVLALLPSHIEIALGSTVRLRAQPTHVVVFYGVEVG